MSKAVLSEIARLEGELARIQRELDVLRHKVDGSGRKTQALAAFKTQPPPALPRKPADDVATSVTLPPPPLQRRAHDSVPPMPSGGAVSEVIAVAPRHDDTTSKKDDSGRIDAGQVGLSAPPPPHSNATPSRRNAAVHPDAGRYVTVGEGRSPRRR